MTLKVKCTYAHYVTLGSRCKMACWASYWFLSFHSLFFSLIIIMYIYHALINALSAHMIHINLNMIFYTYVEHSPTKTIYMKYYKNKTNLKNALQTHTHTLTVAETGF